jgi:DNA primase
MSVRPDALTVNDEKGFYHCFGCGAHGDDIEFAKSKSGSLTLTMSRSSPIRSTTTTAFADSPAQSPCSDSRKRQIH